MNRTPLLLLAAALLAAPPAGAQPSFAAFERCSSTYSTKSGRASGFVASQKSRQPPSGRPWPYLEISATPGPIIST